MYLLMASAHRYAIDYIEQAPVIVLAAARGNAVVSRTERAFIQEQFRRMCQSKARLRDVMHSYGLPLLSTGHELSVRMGFQISLGDGGCCSGISRHRDCHSSLQAGGRGAWAAAGL